MANSDLFSTKTRAAKTRTNAVNDAGGRAYAMSDKHALAQYAVTCTFGGTYYVDGKAQLDKVLELANNVEPEFLAKVAIYSRKYGYLKDMPAFLMAVLVTKDPALAKKIFPQVIDNGRMLRNFVQIMRSGTVGRKSLGSASKKMVERWLRNASDDQVFKASVGNDPSLADVIKMVHPAPETTARDHLYAYVTGKKFDGRSLPSLVKKYERFKKATPGSREIPDVPFQMLDSMGLTDDEWVRVAENARWQMTRMNLNTFARHNVFEKKGMTTKIASRLKSRENVERARAFPYQLFQAWRSVNDSVPARVKASLEDAMEIAVDNVPPFEGKIFVGVDFSSSMFMGVNGGSYCGNSPISCNNAASLFASCILRQNPDTEMYRFDTKAYKLNLNPRDSVMENARKIGLSGGGTNCACVLQKLNAEGAKGDAVFIISDNESWAPRSYYLYNRTRLQTEWDKFVKRNPNAKLICIDLAANSSTQAVDRKGQILNVGGFSDTVFKVTQAFLESSGTEDYWSTLIEDGINLG